MTLQFFLVFSLLSFAAAVTPPPPPSNHPTAAIIASHPHHRHHITKIRPPPPHRRPVPASPPHRHGGAPVLQLPASDLRSPPPPPQIGRVQFNNILDAILGCGDFGAWRHFPSGEALGIPPLSATIFVSSGISLPPLAAAADPLSAQYHVIPNRLLFSDLLNFKINSRLPTLLASKSILVTNNTASNLTLDGALLTEPDLFTSDTVAFHGLDGFLDYVHYGDSKQEELSTEPALISPPVPAILPAMGDSLLSAAPSSSINQVLLFSIVWFGSRFM